MDKLSPWLSSRHFLIIMQHSTALVLLPTFDYQTVKEAMILEQQNRMSHGTDSNITLNTTQTTKPSSLQSITCDFCQCPRHNIESCFKYQDAKYQAQEEVKERQKICQRRAKGEERRRLNKLNGLKEK